MPTQNTHTHTHTRVLKKKIPPALHPLPKRAFVRIVTSQYVQESLISIGWRHVASINGPRASPIGG